MYAEPSLVEIRQFVTTVGDYPGQHIMLDIANVAYDRSVEPPQ